MPTVCGTQVTATPEDGYTLAGWGESCGSAGTDPTCTIATDPNEDTEYDVTASFAPTASRACRRLVTLLSRVLRILHRHIDRPGGAVFEQHAWIASLVGRVQRLGWC
jgi:hypothetical protein